MGRKSKVIIACKVFYDEMQQCLPPDADVEIIWIDAALHADLDRLEQALKSALSAAGAPETEVRLFLGVGCHPDMLQLTKEYGAGISPVKNCLEAFLGPKHQELEKDGTMIMTPGWIRAWPGIMAALGWDAVDVRINLGRYNRILLLDPGINPLTDEEILAFFDLTQVPVDLELLELQHFRQVLAELLQ
jgi:hypothetical protein